MILRQTNPTRIYIEDATDGEIATIRDYLKYEDKSVSYQIQQFKHAHWYIDKYGVEAYKDRLQELERSRIQSLLLEDDGRYYTHSGLAQQLSIRFNTPVINEVVYPKYGIVGYRTPLPYTLYKFQEETTQKLLEAKHGSASLATGLGKSSIILEICKEIGLKTVVMTPSINIAKQLLKLFKTHLGQDRVGQFFKGKKQSDKLFTIAVVASLAGVEKGSEAWENLSSALVVCGDEAHLQAATTFEEVSLNLLGGAPYRYFLSATLFRNDGLDLLLKGVVGSTVYEMTLLEGIEGNYLSKPEVTMFHVSSNSNFTSKNPGKMHRKHFLENQQIIKLTAAIANQYGEQNKQVLILIDEVFQFSLLQPHLKYEVGFAHGGNSSDKIHPDYIKSDPTELVERFNRGELPILVGTSCISTGTDIRRNEATIYLCGQMSHIAVSQGALGRSTRLCPEISKNKCQVIDFFVDDIPMLKRHSKVRKSIYIKELNSIRELDIKI